MQFSDNAWDATDVRDVPEEILEQFLTDLTEGRSTSISDYLVGIEPDRARPMFRSLLATELRYRLDFGLAVDLEAHLESHQDSFAIRKRLSNHNISNITSNRPGPPET